MRPVDQACAFEDAPIEKIAHEALLRKAPDVVDMLRRMNVGLEPINQTLAWANDNEVEDWGRAAVYYLRTYNDRWKAWVTPEAAERIETALAAAPP